MANQDDAPTQLAASDAYRKWVADLPKIRETFLDSLGGHAITALPIRVDNFLGQLAHELKEAAMAEQFPTPAQKG